MPQPMTVLLLLLIFGLGAVAAWVVGPTKERRWGALLVVGWALFVPLLLRDGTPLEVGGLSLISIAGTMRVWDLIQIKEPTTPLWRQAFLFAFFDIRLMKRERPPHLVHLLLTGILFLGGMALAGVVAAGATDQVEGWAGFVLRWMAGTTFFYCFVDGADRFYRGLYGLAGLTMPPMQSNPILSTSVANFWSSRWNAEVHRWVKRHVFLPFTRRVGSGWAMLAAFAFTALVHAWPTALALQDKGAILWMGLFFVVQGVLLGLERILRVHHWPTPLARVWTVTVMLVTAPLFVEPGLQLVGY